MCCGGRWAMPDGFPSEYTLICPELNQGYLPLHFCWTSQFFQRKNESWFYETFVPPAPDVERVQQYYPPSGDLFERLPNEIIDVIFDYVLDDDNVASDPKRLRFSKFGDIHNAVDYAREDFIALCLSSARLWPLALGRLHRGYKKYKWAGKKVGFHHEHSIFTAEQMRNYYVEAQPMRCVFNMKRNMDHISTRPDMEWVGLMHPSHGFTSERGLKMCKYEMRGRPEDRDKIERDLTQPNLRIDEREWVLRNLTTKQYIRSDELQEPIDPAPDWAPPPKSREPLLSSLKRHCKTLAHQMRKIPKEIEHPGLDKDETFTLANIFLVLTSSSAPNLRPISEKDAPERYLCFGEGPWVGCAFDVIPLDDHLQSQQQSSESETLSHEPWVNVSKEVVADVANLHFCRRRKEEMKTSGHKHYVSSDNPTAYAVYWADFWAKVTHTRKLHRKWVKACPPRPWIDESIYAET